MPLATPLLLFAKKRMLSTVVSCKDRACLRQPCLLVAWCRDRGRLRRHEFFRDCMAADKLQLKVGAQVRPCGSPGSLPETECLQPFFGQGWQLGVHMPHVAPD